MECKKGAFLECGRCGSQGRPGVRENGKLANNNGIYCLHVIEESISKIDASKDRSVCGFSMN